MSITVQFTNDTGGYLKGQVLTVDDNSAKALIGRKAAEKYDGKKEVVARPPRPGVVHVVQVADADPGPAAPEPKTDEKAAEVVAAADAEPDAPHKARAAAR